VTVFRTVSTESSIPSLAEAQRMTSMYAKMEYGVKRVGLILRSKVVCAGLSDVHSSCGLEVKVDERGIRA
jgi:hypothetical protein